MHDILLVAFLLPEGFPCLLLSEFINILSIYNIYPVKLLSTNYEIFDMLLLYIYPAHTEF